MGNFKLLFFPFCQEKSETLTSLTIVQTALRYGNLLFFYDFLKCYWTYGTLCIPYEYVIEEFVAEYSENLGMNIDIALND